MNEKRIRIWIILSFLIPFILFVLSVAYDFMPRFQIGNSNQVLNFEIVVPWIATVVGLVFFILVFKKLAQPKSRAIYLVLYLGYLVLLTHFSLTFSFVYDYNKRFEQGMEKEKFEGIVKAFPPEGNPLSQEQAIEKAKKICVYLGYDLKNWNFKCQQSYTAKFYEVGVSPLNSNVDGGLGFDIEEDTGKVTGIGVVSKKHFSLLPRKEFL